MLGKVIKYEWKAASRQLLPFFGLAIVLSAMLRLLQLLSGVIWEPVGAILSSLVGGLGILLLVAVVVAAVVVLIVRFYQSMMGREAYLTFTLPVKASTHLWGRLVVAILYSLLACVIALVCGLIMIPGFGGILSGDFSIPVNVMGDIVVTLTPSQFPSSIIWSVVGLIVFFVLLAIISNLTRFYASFAIGTRLGPNRPVGSLFSYLILNGAMTVLILPFVAIPLIMVAAQNSTFFNMFNGIEARLNELAGNVEAYAGYAMELMWTISLVLGGIMLLFSVVEIIICWYFYGKKLNLE